MISARPRVQLPPFAHRKHPSPPGAWGKFVQYGSKYPWTQIGMVQSVPFQPVRPPAALGNFADNTEGAWTHLHVSL